MSGVESTTRTEFISSLLEEPRETPFGLIQLEDLSRLLIPVLMQLTQRQGGLFAHLPDSESPERLYSKTVILNLRHRGITC